MARDDHTMYAAVKVLNSILNSSPMSEKLMRHMHGYQVGALLFFYSDYRLSIGELPEPINGDEPSWLLALMVETL